MEQLGIWEPLAVKAQTYKTAVEVGDVYKCLIINQSIQFSVIKKVFFLHSCMPVLVYFFPSCLDGHPVTAH